MDFLRQPYPFLHQGRGLLRIFFYILVVGFLFEYIVIPFERNPAEHRYDYWIICLFHVGVAAITYLIFFFGVSRLVNLDDWRVYKEAITVFFALLLIGIGEWLIRDLIYDNPMNWHLSVFFIEVYHAFIAGAIIMTLVIYLNYHLSKRANLRQLQKLQISRFDSSANARDVMIKTGTKADDFSLKPKEILCVKSDGNYLEFYLSEGNGFTKVLKRMTLQSALDQLDGFSFIIKTHRTFLVNSLHIKSVVGNAAGYQLELNHLDFQVPVSRGHIKAFNNQMS